MQLIQRLTTLLCATLALAISQSELQGESITLTSPEGSGVVANGLWTEDNRGFRITSSYEFLGTHWHYVYHLSSNTLNRRGTDYKGLRKDISHFAFEVSKGFALGEIIIDGTFSSAQNVSLTLLDLTPGAQGNSNPGLPDELHAIKVDLNEDSGTLWFEFDSFRRPILGSFYAKDGRGTDDDFTWAYNTGLDPNYQNGQFIYVPDSEVPIPEPTTMLILSSTLGIAGAVRRRKRQKAA